jgi:hypothetical protein
MMGNSLSRLLGWSGMAATSPSSTRRGVTHDALKKAGFPPGAQPGYKYLSDVGLNEAGIRGFLCREYATSFDYIPQIPADANIILISVTRSQMGGRGPL